MTTIYELCQGQLLIRKWGQVNRKILKLDAEKGELIKGQNLMRALRKYWGEQYIDLGMASRKIKADVNLYYTGFDQVNGLCIEDPIRPSWSDRGIVWRIQIDVP